MKFLNILFATVALVIAGFSLFHASRLAGQPQGRLDLVAKGGIYQAPGEADTRCSSARIAPLQPHNLGIIYWLGLQIVCMICRLQQRGLCVEMRFPGHRAGSIADSCRDIVLRSPGSAASAPCNWP